MKSQEPQEKKFRQLSDEELEKVNGGMKIKPVIEDRDYQRACVIDQCPPGERLDTTLDHCQCVPVPNTDYRYR